MRATLRALFQVFQPIIESLRILRVAVVAGSVLVTAALLTLLLFPFPVQPLLEAFFRVLVGLAFMLGFSVDASLLLLR